jgi:micrococcal nuclease
MDILPFSRRQLIRGSVILFLLIAGLITDQLAHPKTNQEALILPEPSRTSPPGFVLVAKVIDGDTIELSDGSRIRYIGINTPETVDPRRPVQCFGKEASAANKSLVEGNYIRLVRDISDRDKYDRLLRYIYLEDGTFVNLTLVAQGYAQVSTYPPDIAHTKEFQAAQAEAKALGRGLWSSCPQ